MLAAFYKSVKLVFSANPKSAITLCILTLLQGLIPVAQLWISKFIVDIVATYLVLDGGEEKLTHLLLLFLMQAGLFILVPILSNIQACVNTVFSEWLSFQMKQKIHNKAMEIELSRFEDAEFYDVLQNANTESSSRPLGMLQQGFNIIQNIITLLGTLLLLLALNPVLLGVILICSAPTFFIYRKFGELKFALRKRRTPEIRQQSYFTSLLTSYWHIKEIRTYELECYFWRLAERLFKNYHKENTELALNELRGKGAAILLAEIGRIVTLGYLFFLVIERTISVGDFTLFTGAIATTLSRAQAIFINLASLYENSLFFENYFEFLSFPEMQKGKKRWNQEIREIEFLDVSFTYPGSKKQVLKKINFTISSGDKVALVGANGAGKTTIVKLICQFYQPDSGKILINGQDSAEYSPESIRRQMAVLFQDFGHYHVPIKNNIFYGNLKNEGEVDKIKHFANQSTAHEFILQLPEKYETMLGKQFENGVELSVGQWQKIALSRALFKESSVLILDEPTAALDSKSEYSVLNNLYQRRSGILILVSHRLSTCTIVDAVIELGNGTNNIKSRNEWLKDNVDVVDKISRLGFSKDVSNIDL